MGSRAFVPEESALERRVLETTRYSITLRRRLWALLNPRRKNINLIQLPLFPWCCVAKIKIKPLLFNGQKAKPYNLPFRRRQWCAPVSGWCALADWSRGQSCKSRGECGGKGNSHFLARSWRQGKSGISAFLFLPRKGSEFPPRLVPWHLPCILLKWHPRFVARLTCQRYHNATRNKHYRTFQMRKGFPVLFCLGEKKRKQKQKKSPQKQTNKEKSP